MLTIEKEIDSLPPLPETVIEINKFKLKKDKEIEELVKILEKDPLVVSNILKVANSAMFGFRNPIETFARAVNMIGMNMAISLTLSIHILNKLPMDLKCYGFNREEFISNINESAIIIKQWVAKTDKRLTETIVLPALIMEIGKFVISTFIKKIDKVNEFQEYLKDHNIKETEEFFLNQTSYDVTSKIFKHWNISENLINMISFVDNINNCPEEDQTNAKYLKIFSLILNMKTYKDIKIKKEIESKCLELNLNYSLLDSLLDF